jgi:hypothetical protein
VDFWGVKNSGCGNSEKLIFIPEKKRNVFRLPFLISQQKRLFDQSSFTIQMSLGVFQSEISHENESRIISLLTALTFISLIFRYEILHAKYMGKLKEVKKSQFFSTVYRWKGLGMYTNLRIVLTLRWDCGLYFRFLNCFLCYRIFEKKKSNALVERAQTFHILPTSE